MSAFISAAAQRNRILDFLRNRPLDTLTARKELDVMHPAARVMELRKRGVGIKTIEIDRASDCGKIHRVVCYVLVAEVVAPTPADKADGVHRQETDTPENSMGDAI
ncbi:helix-turn-helix domain-containing protein [Nitrosomonas ureae]|uniref:Helix-turn-helix domain-containing protein n=1 Tax=Nitrosomonas ureae TaxID=44577 RepID=A0A1H5RWK5_9PROT|nr:helix-turn-helix domain-containing protein [Nitrosomonas ureae]SEF42722.1 Helix-turn-helix domain-containing protein [Nitrosomonas ureae]